jgi:hypothetical protein
MWIALMKITVGSKVYVTNPKNISAFPFSHGVRPNLADDGSNPSKNNKTYDGVSEDNKR